jgi:alcohol dehydrogenase class IV
MLRPNCINIGAEYREQNRGPRAEQGLPLKNFVYAAAAARVIFGAGSSALLPRELDLLGARKALVLCTPEQTGVAESTARLLGERAAGIFSEAVMHVPIETVHAARRAARELGADCAIAIGGGSTTGLGKAIALESGLPILSIPTTYAGSEMTPIYGITEAGMKRTGRDARVLPRTVIYDPELTLTLPVGLSVTSGMNAIAHAAEGLYARDGNPIMNLMAEEGIRALAAALPILARAPQDLPARSSALYGAWLCGTVLGNVGMSLHHKLCHTLGGTFNLPHADVHTVILPQAIAFNAPVIPDALAHMRRALEHADPAAALYDLARHNGAPCSLRELGMAEADLDRAATLAVADPYWNPQPVEFRAIRSLLERAWHGTRPA